MAVYDCFTFFNELDILEIRLNELDPHVDHFVVVEATQTFAGTEKPLYYKENENRFAKFADKIIHVIVDDLPDHSSAWEREAFQRDAMMRGLVHAAPDDIVMISDVDEIPKPQFLKLISPRNTRNRIHFLECEHFNFKLNFRVVGKWIGSGAIRVLEKKHIRSPEKIRRLRARQSRRLPMWLNQLLMMARNKSRFGAFIKHSIYENAGWHFSFMTTTGEMTEKITAYSHQERNTADFNTEANFQKMIDQRRAICGRAIEEVSMTELPAYVVDNQAKYEAILNPGR